MGIYILWFQYSCELTYPYTACTFLQFHNPLQRRFSSHFQTYESGVLNDCGVETWDGLRDLQPTVVTWTTLIAAYCKHRVIDDFFSLYEQMIMSRGVV